MRLLRPHTQLLFSAMTFMAMILSGASAQTPSGTVWVGAGAPQGAKAYRSLAQVPFGTLAKGTTVLIALPLIAETTTVRGASNITIANAPGHTVVFHAPIVFEADNAVTLRGVTVQNVANLAGIIIRLGAAHITVDHVSVLASGLGIWIGNGAGTGHHITNNTLSRNSTHGIAVDVVNSDPKDPTVLSYNTVTDNGQHGFEINGNGYTIEHNLVSGSGILTPGTSGIHIYARDAREHTGQGNTVRYNISHHNHDTSQQDGNGIQLDQWCDNNTVAYNITYENDGAGINIFDASNNRIYNNTALGNARDPGHSHAYRGEMTLASDYVHAVDHTWYNAIYNNVLVSTEAGVVPLFIDKSAAGRQNATATNWLSNEAMAPQFRNAQAPLNGGLMLTARSAKPSQPIDINDLDLLGQRAASPQAPGFGVYFTP